MPVIRPTGRGEPLASVRDHLADLLVKELMGERSRRGPVVFELPTERQDMVDVIVVWEAFRSLPAEDRSAVVREAYARYARILESSIHYLEPDKPRNPLAPAPATVIPATWDDDALTDLLPYEILAQPSGEVVDLEDFRLMILELGAIETPLGPRLRFPDAEMAADALARLRQELPEGHWLIVETVGSVDGGNTR